MAFGKKPVYYMGPHKRLVGKSKTAHRTTILINKEDWDFLQQTNLKPTNLLRSKINELRNKGFSTDWEKAADRLRTKLEKVVNAMGETLDEETLKEVFKKAS